MFTTKCEINTNLNYFTKNFDHFIECLSINKYNLINSGMLYIFTVNIL